MKQRETKPMHGRAKTLTQINGYLRRSMVGTVWDALETAAAIKGCTRTIDSFSNRDGVVDVIYDLAGNIYCKDRERCASTFEIAEARDPLRTVGTYRADTPVEYIVEDIEHLAQTEFQGRAAA